MRFLLGPIQCPWQKADALVEDVITILLKRLSASEGDQIALMVNGLGSTPEMELMIIVRKAVMKLEAATGRKPTRIHVGTFMTALDRQGVSLTLCKMNSLRAERLEAPTNAPAWRESDTSVDIIELEEASPYNKLSTEPIAMQCVLEALPVIREDEIRAICDAIVAAEPQLTEWDEFNGNGDYGHRIARGAKEVLRRVETFPLKSAAATFKQIAECISSSMEGTCGALLEIGIRAGQSCLTKKKTDLCGAFKVGCDAIRLAGGAEEGMRTMLDAMMPALRVIEEGGSLEEAVVAAEAGAEATKIMEWHAEIRKPSDCFSGENIPTNPIPDPGAMAFAISIRAVHDLRTTELSNFYEA